MAHAQDEKLYWERLRAVPFVGGAVGGMPWSGIARVAVGPYEDALIEFGLHCFAPAFAAPGAASSKRLQAAFDAAAR